MGAWAQGTECPDYDGQYDVYYSTPSNFYDSTQHNTGEHLYINSGNATCLFLTGTPDRNGGYYCRSKVTASWGTGIYTELGNTVPTIVGAESPAVHRSTYSDSGTTSQGYTHFSTLPYTTTAAMFTECWQSDSLCTAGSITWISQNPIFNPVVRSYGHTLYEPVYTASPSSPALTASTYTPIVIPLHGGNYPDGTLTDLEDGVMFNFTGRGAAEMSWIAKDTPYGFLVMPARGVNGQITTGRAMLGTLTVQPAPSYKPDPTHIFISNGFNALSIFDIPLDDNIHQYYTNGKRYSGRYKRRTGSGSIQSRNHRPLQHYTCDTRRSSRK